jgi:hypothetical protein
LHAPLPTWRATFGAFTLSPAQRLLERDGVPVFLFGNFDVWKVAPMLQGADLREVDELSRRFRSAIAAFLTDGDPNAADLPRWPAFGEARTVLHIDRRITASGHLG